MKPSKSTPFHSPASLAAAFAVALFSHFAAPYASAANRYWSADGININGSGTWDTALLRWGSVSGGPYNLAWVNGIDVAVLGTAAASNLTLGENITCGGIFAQNNSASSGNINEGSGPFTLTLGVTGSNVFTATQGATAGRRLIINTSIAGAAGANVVLAGPSSSGTGTMALNRANTFVGGTSFSGNSSGAVNLTLGNQLALQNSTLTLSAACKTLIFSSTVAANAFTFGGLASTTTGAGSDLVLQNNATTPAAIALSVGNNNANTSYAAALSGAGSLVKIGTGTLTLSGSNTFSGNTTISNGKLQGVVGGSCVNSKIVLDNPLATLAVSITDNTKTWTCKELAPTAAKEIEFNFGAITPSTSLSPLTITAPAATGQADFTAATPKVKVNVDTGLAAGTYPLMTWDNVSGTVPSTADLTVLPLLAQTVPSLSVSVDGLTLNLVITSTAVSTVKANNPTNLDDGLSWVGGTAPGTESSATWNSIVTSPNTTNLGADLTWAGITIENPNGPVTINGTNTLTLGAAAVDINLSTTPVTPADLTLNCPLTLGAANVWDVAATRTLTLGGPVSGAFDVTKLGAGTLQLSASNLMPDGVGSGNFSLTGTLDLKGNSETINGLSGTGVIDNTGLTASTFTVGANDQTSTFSGLIQNSGGTLNLAKTGNGTLTLSNANTFSGVVNISGGTLSVNNIAPLNNVTGIIMNDGTTLRTNVDNAVINAPITLGAVGTTTTINASNFDGSGSTLVPFTLGGAISGNGNLTLSGIEATNSYGLIILNAASNYTGSTLMTTVSGFAGGPPINANIFVRLGTENALPATTVLTLDGGDGAGSGGRSCELNLNGKNQTLAGLTNVMTVAARNQTVTNTGAPATLTVNNSADYTFGRASIHQFNSVDYTTRARIQGDISLVKSGVGWFTLVESHTYTGTTTITGGTLALGSSDALPTTPVSIGGGGTLRIGPAFTDTVGTLALASAATISLGNATSALAFADSSGETWAGPLSLTGPFVSGVSLRFGTTGGGLSLAQLASISAIGWTGFGLDTNGYLTATSTGGYSSWQATNGTAQTIDLDHDSDGVSNGVEYFLGGNTNTTGFTALPGVTNTAGTLSVTWTKGATYTGTYGIDFWVETSATLANPWVEQASPGTVTFPSATEVKYTFPPGTSNFARLKVTGP